MSFTTDTFTDAPGTLLENHTADSGALWTKNPVFATGSAAITAAGRLRGNATNGAYFESVAPSSADYDVEADLYVASNVNNVGLLGRQSITAQTFYLLDYESAGSFNLYTVVGATTLNTTTYFMGLAVGQTYHLRLSMRGSRITCYVNGVQIIGITDTNITSANRAGMLFTSADTDSTGYHLDNFTAANPLTVAVTDSKLFFSPYNWSSDGGGSMQPGNVNAASTLAQTNTPGAYLKFSLNAATSGMATLLLDTTPLNGITAANCPTLAISIDGQAFTTSLLAYATGTTRLLLAANLSAGTHTVVIFFRSVTLNSSAAAGDRWNTPASAVKVTGLELDGKGSATATQTVLPRRMIVYGDSITEGADALGSTNANADQDATLVFAQLVAAGLGAEVAVVGFSAQGWTVGGYGNVPALYDTATPANSAFDKYFAGASRLAAGRFTPAPDYIMVAHGHNDAAATDATVTAAVSGWLTAARAAAPASRILVVVPFNGAKRTAISAGVTAVADPNLVVIDLGSAIDPALTTGGLNTNDGIHPSARGHAFLSSPMLWQVRPASDAAGSFTASTGNFTGANVSLSTGDFTI